MTNKPLNPEKPVVEPVEATVALEKTQDRELTPEELDQFAGGIHRPGPRPVTSPDI